MMVISWCRLVLMWLVCCFLIRYWVSDVWDMEWLL